MHLATTAQLALVLEFWGDGGSHWRVPPPESAGKQEGVSPPTCKSEVWTSRFQTHLMVGLEVVADGFPLFGGAQLAVDTTLVSPLHADGSPHRHAADTDGAVLATSTTQEGTHVPRARGA